MNWMGYFWHVCQHKFWVFYYICCLTGRLLYRGIIHDYSKFKSDEFTPFKDNYRSLNKAGFGTKEYKEILDRMRPSLKLHQERNTHHPEHWHDGIADMNVIDFMEMICDWQAASRRDKKTSWSNSIDICAKRFN